MAMTDLELRGLYERYGSLVERRAIAILGNRADAADARQEVFMRLRKYGVPTETSSVVGWLYRVTANVCFDKLKHHRREEPHGAEDLRALAEAAETTMPDTDRRALVGAILRQADPETRDIGLLYYLDGLTQEEVAREARLSRRTVGKRIKLFDALFARLLGRLATPGVP